MKAKPDGTTPNNNQGRGRQASRAPLQRRAEALRRVRRRGRRRAARRARQRGRGRSDERRRSAGPPQGQGRRPDRAGGECERQIEGRTPRLTGAGQRAVSSDSTPLARRPLGRRVEVLGVQALHHRPAVGVDQAALDITRRLLADLARVFVDERLRLARLIALMRQARLALVGARCRRRVGGLRRRSALRCLHRRSTEEEPQQQQHEHRHAEQPAQKVLAHFWSPKVLTAPVQGAPALPRGKPRSRFNQRGSADYDISGKSTTNRLPWPRPALLATTVPPWASTS